MSDAVDIKKSLQPKKNRSSFFIALFFYAVIMTDIVRQFSSITGFLANDTYVELIRNILYIIIFIGYFVYSTKQTRTETIIVFIAFSFVMLFSVLLNTGLTPFVFTLTLLFVSRNLLAFIMISRLNDPIAVIRKIVGYSWIIIVYVLLQIMVQMNLSTGYAYNTSFSYNLLLPAAACFYSFYILKEKRILSVIAFIIALFGMIVYGARGTVLCIIAAVFYMVLMRRNEYSPQKIVGFVTLAVVVTIALIMKDDLLSLLARLAPKSRTIYLMRTNNFIWNANRDNYYELAKVFFAESPFRITGIGGDVFFYADNLGVSIEFGRHSHNMFLELLVSYGVLLGGVAVIVILYYLLRSFLRARHCPELKTICACIIAPLLPFIFVSGSLCQSYQYWMVLGGAFSVFNRKHYQHTSFHRY